MPTFNIYLQQNTRKNTALKKYNNKRLWPRATDDTFWGSPCSLRHWSDQVTIQNLSGWNLEGQAVRRSGVRFGQEQGQF